MIRIPLKAWPSIDRAINAATRARNQGVPVQFHDKPTKFEVALDTTVKGSRKYVVTKVAFGLSVVTVRQRFVSDNTWVQIKGAVS